MTGPQTVATVQAIRDGAAEAIREVYAHLTRRAREGDEEAWALAHRLDQELPEIVRSTDVSPVTFTRVKRVEP